MGKIKIILIFLTLLFGIGLRSVEVINRNFLFGFDQGRDYSAVKKIVVERKPTLIGAEVGGGMAGLKGIFHGPYYYYSLVLPFLIFEGNPYGGLVLMFIFGVASLFLACFFVQRNFGNVAALVATLLMSVALSDQSRFMWNSHPSTLFILLSFWFAYQSYQNPRRYFFWATFFAGLIYGFQLAISIPLIVSLFLAAFLFMKIRDLRVYLLGIIGVVLAYLPFFVFELRHGFMAIKGLGHIFAGIFKKERLISFSANFRDHLLSFWFNFRNTFLLSHRWHLHFWLMLFLLTVTLYYLIKKRKSQEKGFVCFLLILPLVTFLILMLLNNAVWGHYLVHLHLVYLLLFSIYFS